MAYIIKDTSGLINTRLTDAGRQNLSQGNFNISYFQIGDSEVNYTVVPSYNQTRNNILVPAFNAQNTTAVPQKNKQNVKYPYYVQGSTGGTYGIPFMDSNYQLLYNYAGIKGFFTGSTGSWVAQTSSAYTITSNYYIAMTTLSGQTDINITLDGEEIVQRMLKRGRQDDNEVIIRHRLNVYNEQTAPLQLQNAKKYYYVYTKGRQYYNGMMEKELEGAASKLTQELTTKFNEEVQIAKTMNSYFNISEINSENTIELYEDYVKKNAEMREIIKASRGDVLTNDRKTYYETEALNQLKTVQTVMQYIYWFLLITFIVSIFISSSNLTRKQQIGLVIFFILYPFVINKIVMAIYNYYNDTFIKNTDTNVYLDL